MGLGRLGLTPRELYDLTPAEFIHMQTGYMQAQKQHRYQLYDAARIVAAFALSGGIKKMIKPSQVLQLEGDKPNTPTLNTDQSKRLRQMIEQAKVKKQN